MRPRRPPSDQQEAVARRLELLSAELASVREAAGPEDDDEGAIELPSAAPDTHTRVRTEPGVAPWSVGPAEEWTGEEWTDDEASPPPPPPPLPVPGRHASRRRAEPVLAAVVPATLRGRVVLAPHHLTVVALAVALGLAVTTWWVIRGDAERQPVAASTAPAGGLVSLPEGEDRPTTGHDASSPDTEQADAGATSGEVVVDVAGKVRRPGIAVLAAGSRVVDAIEAAGGARKGVDLTDLNLARVLVDGEQVLVGVEPAAGGPAGITSAPTSPGAEGPLVNLNTADQAALETLPGVGPVTAGAILEWRSHNGAFTSVEELVEVNGIGPATLARLLPLVTL